MHFHASDPSRAPNLGFENPLISNTACQGPGKSVVAITAPELPLTQELTALGWGDLPRGSASLPSSPAPLLPSPALGKWTCVRQFVHLRQVFYATNVRKLRQNRTLQIENIISKGIRTPAYRFTGWLWALVGPLLLREPYLPPSSGRACVQRKREEIQLVGVRLSDLIPWGLLCAVLLGKEDFCLGPVFAGLIFLALCLDLWVWIVVMPCGASVSQFKMETQFPGWPLMAGSYGVIFASYQKKIFKRKGKENQNHLTHYNYIMFILNLETARRVTLPKMGSSRNVKCWRRTVN